MSALEDEDSLMEKERANKLSFVLGRWRLMNSLCLTGWHLLVSQYNEIMSAYVQIMNFDEPRMIVAPRNRQPNFWVSTWNNMREPDFRCFFRMSRNAFSKILMVITPFFMSEQPRDPRGQKGFAPDLALAVFLWRVCTKCTVAQIALTFGIGEGSVTRLTLTTINAILNSPMNRLIQFPTNDASLHALSIGFAEMGFTNCVAAIDGSHIRIQRPSHDPIPYANRKKYYSIVMHAVVDSMGRFLSVNVGWPGSVPDIRILKNSGFFIDIVPILEQKKYYVLADGGYPLRKWLLTPYKVPTTAENKYFNYRQSSARVVVERTFGRLKARFRRLQLGMDFDLKTTVDCVLGCCYLHNFLELLPDERNAILEMVPENEENAQGYDVDDVVAESFRTDIAKYLYENRAV